MKNQTTKKSVLLNGKVKYMKIGESAIIFSERRTITTSAVIHTIENPDGSVWLETQNTFYTVIPEERAGV